MVFAQRQQYTSIKGNAGAMVTLISRCFPEFKSILKPADKQYRDKMIQMKPEQKGKAPYTEKLNTCVQSGWCLHNMFAYEDVLDPSKMYLGKDCVEKFVELIENEVKRLYTTLPQQPLT